MGCRSSRIKRQRQENQQSSNQQQSARTQSSAASTHDVKDTTRNEKEAPQLEFQDNEVTFFIYIYPTEIKE